MNARWSTWARRCTALLLVFIATVALGQEAPDPLNIEEQLITAYDKAAASSATGSVPTAEPQPKDYSVEQYHQFRMAQQRHRVTFAILLGVTALLAHFVVLRSLPRNNEASSHIVSATGLIYIVFGTIILVVIANTETQLTASMGILGAVAGYLFGKQRSEAEREPQNPAEKAKGSPDRAAGSTAR